MTESAEQIAKARIAEALKAGATELDLAGLGLRALPEAIGELTALRSLELSRNRLSALPEAIGQLTALQSPPDGRLRRRRSSFRLRPSEP